MSTRMFVVSVVLAGIGMAPSFSAAMQGVAREDALDQSGELGSGELTPFMKITLAGDYVAAGTGLADRDEGQIVIDGIPEDAEVIGAMLYWSFVDVRGRASHRHLTIGGFRAEGELIGTADTCHRGSSNFAYRAVLSRDDLDEIQYEPLGPLPEVPEGNGTYVISGYPRDDVTVPLGASLVLVYRDDAQPVRDLVFVDGNMMPAIGPPPPFIYRTKLVISGFLAAEPPLGHTTFIVGDGSPSAPDLGLYISASGRSRLPVGWSFNSDDGPYWDTDDLDLSWVIGPGETYGEAHIWVIGQRGPGGLYYFDCLNWIAQVLSVTSQHAPDADPAGAF